MRTVILCGLSLTIGCVSMKSPAVSHSTEENWRSNSEKARVRTLVEGGNAWIGTLVLAPEVDIPMHSDPTEEYIVVTEGGGTIWINGEQHILVVGSAAFMPAECGFGQARPGNWAGPVVFLRRIACVVWS